MAKYEKNAAISGSTLTTTSTARPSFGGLHLWGYAIASAREAQVIREQRRTAEKYYDIALRDHQYWKDNYRQKEIDFRDEAFAIPVTVPNYEENLSAQVYDIPAILKQEHTILEGIPLSQIGRRWRINIESRKRQMVSRAVGYVTAYRMNYSYAERENIRRMARRTAAVNVGIQAGNQATAGFGQATGRLISSLSQVQGSISSLRKGFGEAIGKMDRENEE